MLFAYFTIFCRNIIQKNELSELKICSDCCSDLEFVIKNFLLIKNIRVALRRSEQSGRSGRTGRSESADKTDDAAGMR